MAENENQAKAIIDFAKQNVTPQLVDLEGPTGRKAKVLVLPSGNGLNAIGIKPFLDAYLTAPERREGVALVYDMPSFIDHVKRFADSDSVIFADPTPGTPSLVAVLDYHRAGATSEPRFGKHRTRYAFPLSDEWKAWKAKNAQGFTQKEFAEFIEDRIADIADSYSASDSSLQLAAKLGGTFATPGKLVDLSREFSVREGSAVKQAQNLSSGEAQISYVTQHTDDDGKPLKVPSLFLIHIPVFRAGAPYEIAVRLRYRLKEGRITWFYELYRADKVFDHAFNEACANAAASTGLPVIVGSPET
jgi:uncharacterized protein YfdQ (DUF2303 family)